MDIPSKTPLQNSGADKRTSSEALRIQGTEARRGSRLGGRSAQPKEEEKALMSTSGRMSMHNMIEQVLKDLTLASVRIAE